MGRYMVGHRCPRCGAEFFPPVEVEWAYKTVKRNGNIRLFCSWHCLRAEQERKPKKKKTRPKVANEIIKLLAMGFRMYEVAEILGVTADMVKYWRNRYIEEMEP